MTYSKTSSAHRALRLFAGLVAALLGLACGAAGAARAPIIPVSTLFSNPPFSTPKLSADGKTYAFIRSAGDTQVIYSMSVYEGKATALANIVDPEIRLAWIEWANAHRLLISGQGRNLHSIGVRARITRLFGVNLDGSDYNWLGEKWPVYGQFQYPVQYQDQIVHWLPDDPENVLIQVWAPTQSSPQVARMNVKSGRLKTVQPRMAGVREWFADRDGVVRAAVATKGNIYILWFRLDEKSEFTKAIEHDAFDASGATFAGFHADKDRAYVRTLVNGRDALAEYHVPTRTVGTVVFTHPEVDIDGIQRDPGPGRQVVGVRYTVDRPEVYFLDNAAEKEHRGLRRALEGEFGFPVYHEPVSISQDGSEQILEVSSDVQAPTYYFYDRKARRLTHILEQFPDLKSADLAPTRRVTYRARDGLEIPAYLTVPVGIEPKNLPAVALVHGGPWARDWIRWDPEVQLLANRGFVVLQMNFRGSTGFGQQHLESGYREWGQKIQDDITDGVKWLIAEGIADPDRVGITGSSYGGYATLVGLVKTPEMYRAGAAYASVTDIEFLISDDKWYDWDISWHETMVGGERGDKKRLRESSPLRRAAEIRVPVLLGHGADDQRVHVRQSQRMTEALRKAGKQVTYLEFPDEVHGFLLESNRVRWYEALVSFFEENLAPRKAAEPSSN